ncbi:hypothetical protein GCM10020218_095370 [Dactylosporangium vinaceum]
MVAAWSRYGIGAKPNGLPPLTTSPVWQRSRHSRTHRVHDRTGDGTGRNGRAAIIGRQRYWSACRKRPGTAIRPLLNVIA